MFDYQVMDTSMSMNSWWMTGTQIFFNQKHSKVENNLAENMIRQTFQESLMEMDSDEELRRELDKAVKKCKQNKQLDESKPKVDVLSHPSDRSFQTFINQKQLAVENNFKKNTIKERSKISLTEMDSDEEFNRELDNAVKKCKQNKQIDERKPYAKKEMPKCENEKIYNNTQNDTQNNTFKTKKNLNTKKNSKDDAFRDIAELINYFFLPKNLKSHSDYEKQGAIPKSRVKNGSRENNSSAVMDLIARLGSVEKSQEKDDKAIHNGFRISLSESTALNSHFSDEIIKVSEETCVKPFFYIVPEYPSPNFFLPRGSYYVIPEVPVASAEESIVFHPEIGTHSESKLKRQETSEIQSECIEINNLNKDTLEKLDSHLNIGPRDVKLHDSTNNLETSCSANKIYEKDFVSNANKYPMEEREYDLEIVSQEVQDNTAENYTKRKNAERLDSLLQKLMAEFPNWSLERLSHFAQKYLNDEAGLEQFLASERLERKIQEQFERLVLALPESDRSLLLQQCKIFKGDEDLVNAYIEEVQLANRIEQRVMDLLTIFPDADPEFLHEEVRKLGDNHGGLTDFTERLLESGNYPKVLEDKEDLEKKKLWDTYIVNFSVKKYLRNVPNPEKFAGPEGDNNKADEALILRYLQSRYLSTVDVLTSFRAKNRNLTKTCDYLNSSEVVTPLGNFLKNEPFDEEFLKEVCYIEHKEEIDSFLNEMRERKEIEKEDALLNDCFWYCPLCSNDELVASEVFPCPEGHMFCIECIQRYLSVKIGDGVYKFRCPSDNCESFFTFKALENILPEKTLAIILQKQQAEEVSSADIEGLETCPHCEFAYIPNPGDKIFRCQNLDCLIETCRKCGEKNHIPLRCEEIERPADVEARKKIEETMTSQLVRVCPTCQKRIVKIDGCNKMACSCGTLFCYLCRNKITSYNHFYGGGCPLYSNNESLHNTDVIAAGIRTRNQILQENPNIRILHDPTSSHNNYY